jgi:hypothetical protein
VLPGVVHFSDSGAAGASLALVFRAWFVKCLCWWTQRLSGCDSPIPLAIMTSDDTHGPTQALLHKNDNFGMDKDQVIL